MILTWDCHYLKITAGVTQRHFPLPDWDVICHLPSLFLPVPAGELWSSNACIMQLAKRAASSLLPKLSPHTCLGSRHWWKFGVAWLYFIPLIMGQLITTWHEQEAQDSDCIEELRLCGEKLIMSWRQRGHMWVDSNFDTICISLFSLNRIQCN